ncbi:imidazole glycerol phosphate synthase subunit HisH [Solidesulfovibrio sp.]|uniref:imidazole glycerol phosphate synthase subunit HisH n=1 Tax=Solidesulfovibrio sp. TaxID=2910990 RepID=UPI002B20C06E|nr:imidazole glycerol phosphate synthase subunit HisH [Solidesulfovibrio sp.]MEA5090918.1 imidazole glycerol phosphate synthase subunit HisH [Solidesulfovibrio sp.]
MSKTAIIDYALGNLRSVANAVHALGGEPVIAATPDMLADCDRIILPGVGAFGDGMDGLRRHGWIAPLTEHVMDKGKPFLGICLGMQLLAEAGAEHGRHQGLGWLPGTVELLETHDPGLRVPHIGWNDVALRPGSRLFAGLGESACFYFVHSYVYVPADPAVAAGTCVHGTAFIAAAERDNLFAVQFHPEKSQAAGLAVLRNFLTA